MPLTEDICTVDQLRTLMVYNCPDIVELPEFLGTLAHLRELNLYGSASPGCPTAWAT